MEEEEVKDGELEQRVLEYFYRTGARIEDVAEVCDTHRAKAKRIITNDLERRHEIKRKQREEKQIYTQSKERKAERFLKQLGKGRV